MVSASNVSLVCRGEPKRRGFSEIVFEKVVLQLVLLSHQIQRSLHTSSQNALKTSNSFMSKNAERLSLIMSLIDAGKECEVVDRAFV
jgi:hypothetical protein